LNGSTVTYCAMIEPTIAKGMDIFNSLLARLTSINPLCQYLTSPDEKPKLCVKSATAIADTCPTMMYSGPRRGKTIRKIGINIAAPPIPVNMAVVATSVDIGNINQYVK